LEIELDRWQSLALQAEVIVPGEAVPGAVAQLVIEQIPLNHPHGGPTGAIGIVLQFEN